MKARLAFAVLAAGWAVAAHGQSLFQEESWRGLTADHKAYRPGDVLTVLVFENTSASSSADTGTRRSNHMAAQRASRLLTTRTVTVQEVVPGGQLRVAGTQSRTVNEELQRVTLEGLVRPADISDANVVQSTRIAQARITYVGEGDLTERTRRAWWRKLLAALGF